MSRRRRNHEPSMLGTLARGVPLLAASYAAYVAATWLRYGRAQSAVTPSGARRRLIDRFMPDCEVAEAHQIRVDAPVECTFAAACDMDLNRSWLVQAVFAL